MGWAIAVGHVLFVAVPIALWLLTILAGWRLGAGAPLLAFITGSDNRLSVSRLQAFLWTFIVFGAYAAALAVSTKVTDTTWVAIPNELLELTGVAIASGVISSLIATQTREAKVSVGTPQAAGTGLEITGNLAGASVAFGSDVCGIAPCTPPADNCFLVTRPGNAAFDGSQTLVVETPHGRASYKLKNGVWTPVSYYDFSDLFRNDKNPQNLDLMKFQMFGWTLVALAFYVVYFWMHLSAAIITLPTVDQTVVTLTGISQAGYLVGKGVTGTPS